MNQKTAKQLRKLAGCSTADRPQGRLYVASNTRRVVDDEGKLLRVTSTLTNQPFTYRGYYRHLKRIWNG